MLKKIHIAFFAILLVVISSCKDDTSPILTLQTPEQIDNEVILKWDVMQVPGFQYYMVMRASDGKNYNVINDIVNKSSDAYDQNITTFSDTSFPFTDSLYYKIIAVGDEMVSSGDYLIRVKKPLMLPGDISNVSYMPEENKILVFGYESSKGYTLKLYDFTNYQLINSTSINLTTTGSSVFFGKYNGKYECYFYNSWNSKFYVYDALTLQKTDSMNYWNSYATFFSNDNGLIYANSGSYSTHIIDRQSMTYTYYNGNKYIRYLFYNKEENKLFGTGSYDNWIVKFDLDESGNIVGENLFSLNSYADPMFVENSNLFLQNYNSSYILNFYDTDTGEQHNLDLSSSVYLNNLYKKFNVIYAFAIYSNTVYCISATDFSLIKTIKTRVSPQKLFSDENYLYLVGQYDGNSIVDKIRLIKSK